MISVMKDVETDCAGGQSVGNAKHQLQPAGFGAEKQDKRAQKPDHDQCRLAQQPWIACRRMIREGVADTSADGLQEFSRPVEYDRHGCMCQLFAHLHVPALPCRLLGLQSPDTTRHRIGCRASGNQFTKKRRQALSSTLPSEVAISTRQAWAGRPFRMSSLARSRTIRRASARAASRVEKSAPSSSGMIAAPSQMLK